MSTVIFTRDVAIVMVPTVLLAAAGAILAWKRRSISSYLVAGGFILGLLCALAVAAVGTTCGLDFSQSGPFGCVYGAWLWLTYGGYVGNCVGCIGFAWYTAALRREA